MHVLAIVSNQRIDVIERLIRSRGRLSQIVNQRLERSDLRARLEPAIAPLESVIRRGQESAQFDPELPAEWLITVLIDLVHAASDQVGAGAMQPRGA